MLRKEDTRLQMASNMEAKIWLEKQTYLRFIFVSTISALSGNSNARKNNCQDDKRKHFAIVLKVSLPPMNNFFIKLKISLVDSNHSFGKRF